MRAYILMYREIENKLVSPTHLRILKKKNCSQAAISTWKEEYKGYMEASE